MKIDFLSDQGCWMNAHLPAFIEHLSVCHEVRWIHDVSALASGELLFILSCGQVLTKEHLNFHHHNLVIHASDLPKGRGWSPLTWQILEGNKSIPLCLFEAVTKVDAGKIYLRDEIHLGGHELINELRVLMAHSILRLCEQFINQYPDILTYAQEQRGTPTYYARRSPGDSKLDVNKSLLEQFNLLRIVDNERYPAFFEWRGHKYTLYIQKCSEDI